MGNEVDSKFRGEGDIPLVDIINSLSDDQFTQFMQEGDAAGVLDQSEYPSKFELIARLPTLDEELKATIISNLKAGKKPFE